jgi:hypothetical protein
MRPLLVKLFNICFLAQRPTPVVGQKSFRHGLQVATYVTGGIKNQLRDYCAIRSALIWLAFRAE